MRLAQRLYENGYITYMRTDSTTLSESALAAARRQAAELFGPEFIPDAPRQYTRKVKNAQEAHEAIRPAGDSFRTPQQVQASCRATSSASTSSSGCAPVASQMKDAQGAPSRCGSAGDVVRSGDRRVCASGTVITFRGFLDA
jgi:DNA topoisomerase-1